MMKISIIDADSIIYKICWKYDGQDLNSLKKYIDTYISGINKMVDATHFCL